MTANLPAPQTAAQAFPRSPDGGMDGAPAAVIHRFEAAGLGRAPFRFIGVIERVGPICYPNGMQVGAPGQPMGTCDYCGNGIRDCYVIVSADLKRFEVGSECVHKTGDRGLRRETNKVIAAKRKESEAKRIDAARAQLADDSVRAVLATLPSPNANRPQDTLLVWAEWMVQHAGNSGRMKVARRIATALKGRA